MEFVPKRAHAPDESYPQLFMAATTDEAMTSRKGSTSFRLKDGRRCFSTDCACGFDSGEPFAMSSLGRFAKPGRSILCRLVPIAQATKQSEEANSATAISHRARFHSRSDAVYTSTAPTPWPIRVLARMEAKLLRDMSCPQRA